jgi:A/G-specific adenine glycosylase
VTKRTGKPDVSPAAQAGAPDHLAPLARQLLAWFTWAGRDLPWRQTRDPYRIWLSEIMLQQTQVQTVIPYYTAFIARWPTVADLAGAEEAQVLKSWEGLGYYARARHLLKAARVIADRPDQSLPQDETALLALPGIGDYTAAAILSIAFGQPVAAVDGNVVRVFARLTATLWQPAAPADRRQVRRLAEALLPLDRPGAFNEAVMDLGATVCLPRQPRCPHCPLAGLCLARQAGRTDDYPARPAARTIPVEKHIVLILHSGGLYHVRRRPGHGLLGGLYAFDWIRPDRLADLAAMVSAMPDAAANPDEPIRQPAGLMSLTGLPPSSHRFTHKIWQMTAWLVGLAQPDLAPVSSLLAPEPDPAAADDPDALWVTAADLAALPFPVALERYRRILLNPLLNERISQRDH